MLTCPGCRKNEMVEVSDEGVTLDECRKCGGLWLDADELGARGGVLPPGGIEYRGERRCPRCDVKMLVRPSRVVELDTCPTCHGWYLDRGELEILVKASRLVSAKAQAERTQKRPAAQSAGGPVPKATRDRFAKVVPPAASPDAIEREPTQPRFVCDLCHTFQPLQEQVMGEQVTICKACAARHDIRHDPVARRKAELARQQVRASPLGVTNDDLVSSLLGSGSRGWSSGSAGGIGLALDVLSLLLR